MTDVRISTSQIKLWSDCKTRWAFERIEHRSAPPGPAATFGTNVHAWVAAHLSGQQYPDVTRDELMCAQALLPHLPSRAEAETHFNFVHGGHGWHGYIDAQDGPHIYDHKTIKTLSKVPDLAALRGDPQALIYAVGGAYEYDTVTLQWTYVERPTGAVIPMKWAASTKPQQLDALLPTADAIAYARRTVTEANSLDGNLAACYKYGPCPHRVVCHTYQNRNKTMTTPTKLERQLKLSLGLAPTEPPPAPTVKGGLMHAYIGCLPIKRASQRPLYDMAMLIESANDAIKVTHDVAHWRMIPYTAAGVLAVAIKDTIAAIGSQGPFDVYSVFPLPPEVLSVIITAAAEVTKGAS